MWSFQGADKTGQGGPSQQSTSTGHLPNAFAGERPQRMQAGNEQSSEAAGSGSTAAGPPSITMPKGGGAIRGMGEKFAVDTATGAVTASIPVHTSKARAGCEPQLSLRYNSGSGNGPFGFGWQLSGSLVSRRTDRGVPLYQDHADSDIFLLSGYDDLVPALGHDNATGWTRAADVTREEDGSSFAVRRYIPRVGPLTIKIERWTDQEFGDCHWRVTSADNVTTVYGETSESRIFDPNDPNLQHPTRTFAWLPSRVWDDHGNAMLYSYQREDLRSVNVQKAHEAGRDGVRMSQLYLKSIKYGNSIPTFTDPLLKNTKWYFEVVLDYGDHDTAAPTPSPQKAWPCRRDAFSNHRSGFEIRQYRVCQRILMFHHFPDEADVGNDCLVASTDLTYREDAANDSTSMIGQPRGCFVSKAMSVSYRRSSAGYNKATFPALEFTYSDPEIGQELKSVDQESLRNLPAGLQGSNIEWVDLFGEGTAGMLTRYESRWMYKSNLGGGTFGEAQPVDARPNISSDTQLVDLSGDGRLDWAAFTSSAGGFYKGNAKGGWEDFRTFSHLPNIDWKDPNLRFIDLTGDGLPDVVIGEGNVVTWYPSQGEDGFGKENRRYMDSHESTAPRLVFSDPTESVWTADMTGDGLLDIVKIDRYGIKYWPCLGYGDFGSMVVMSNSPILGKSEETYHRNRVRLADVDGSGSMDLIYLAEDGTHVYFNESGNSWTEGTMLEAFPKPDNLSSVQAIDLLGTGTLCLVSSSALPGDVGIQMRYMDLMGSSKPHLLTRSINNMGLETLYHYAASTKFYQEAKRSGKPWVSSLPFPVHVVEKVELVDHISRSRFTTRYEYHHGYFDGREREFCGFGRVDQYDTEQFEAFQHHSAANIAQTSHVPPLLARHWFHTGQSLEDQTYESRMRQEHYREPGLSEAQLAQLYFRETEMPSSALTPSGSLVTHSLSANEWVEAVRALKGSTLRQELFALDRMVNPQGKYIPAEHPYAVNEHRYRVSMIQPAGDRKIFHPVFFANPAENVTLNYDRQLYQVGNQLLADPRVEHLITLGANIYGQPLDSVSLAYSRRHKLQEDQQFAIDLVGQFDNSVMLARNLYTNAVDTAKAFRIPLPAEKIVYEIHNPPVPKTDPLITNFLGFEAASELINSLKDETQDLPYEDVHGASATDGKPHRRKTEHARLYYRSDDLSTALKLGELQSHALPHRSLKLAGTADMYANVFVATNKTTAADLNNMLTTECGLVHSEGDQNWWVPSGQSFYTSTEVLPPEELQFAQVHFFTARRFPDGFYTAAFKSETIVEYDKYDLHVLQVRDPLQNFTTIGERNPDNSINPTKRGLDYQTLEPKLIMDANRNRTKIAFDLRGFPVRTAILGKPEERIGDDLDDATPIELTDSDIAAYYADPDGTGRRLLGSATTRIVYDLFAYTKSAGTANPRPAFTSSLARSIHVSDLQPNQQADLMINFSFSDGFGHAIQSKVKSAPGPVPKRDQNGQVILNADGSLVFTDTDSPVRWTSSGWSVFDNKGHVVRHFEPYFSEQHDFDFDLRVGMSTINFYDPVGRCVGMLHPDTTWSKVDYDPWKYETWDEGDTVSISDPKSDPEGGFHLSRLEEQSSPTWYEQRINGQLGPEEKAAAQKSLVYGGTPTTAYFDSRGNVIFGTHQIVTQYSNSSIANQPNNEGYQSSTMKLDIQGHQTEVLDSMKRICASTVFDMLGHELHQRTMDGGERWTLYSLAGESVYRWSSRGFRLNTKYDELRRTIAEYLLDDGGTQRKMLVREYGESRQNAEAQNLRGQLVTVCDQAGKVTMDEYDFKGKLRKTTRTLAQVYNQYLDWSSNVPLEGPDFSFTSSTNYDALSHPIQLTQYDGTKMVLTYDTGGRLQGIAGNLQGSPSQDIFVQNIVYNARGLRTQIKFGNGIIKDFKFDPLTFRLRNMTATRGGTKLQDLQYFYDVQGNITLTKDSAQAISFFRNETISADKEYTYDSVSRLLEATGREHLGQGVPGRGYDSATAPFIDFQTRMVSGNDRDAMSRYLQRYTYDQVNNMRKMQHEGASGANSWTRTYQYAQQNSSNRLTSTTISNATENYAYDGLAGAHGNMTSMPHLSLLQWNFMDQIQATAKTRISNGTPETTWYVYEAGGQRVRKVTESQAAAGQTPVRKRERIYLGACELYREYETDGKTIKLERRTLRVTDDEAQIARVDVRTKGTEASVPGKLYRYQLTDHLQSVCMELDEQGQLASYEEYTPFGVTSYSAVQNQLEVPRIRRWNNKERDDETGLYNFGARYFAPWLGRWTSADPAGLVDGLNVFAYTSNNPIMKSDPTGNNGVKIGLGELGVYADQILERAKLGLNVQREHTLQKQALKQVLGEYAGKLYNWNHDLTVAAETGKGKWHTIKSTLERAVRLDVQSGKVNTLNEFVHDSVNVVVKANEEAGWGSKLTRGQQSGILQQLGKAFEQMTLKEAGKAADLLDQGKKAEVDKLIDGIKANADVNKERKLAQVINADIRAEKAAQTALTTASEAKALASGAAAAGAKAGGGKLMMRGAGVALSMLQLATAKTAEERTDAKIGLVGNLLLETPHPVAKAAGGGIVAGQMIENTFHVSNYSAEAGIQANVKMREMGFKEDTATVVGAVVTVVATPIAIPVAVVSETKKFATNLIHKWF